MEEIFYTLSADTGFRFSDGEVIKFNRGMFYNAVRSEPIYHILFGPLRDNETVITDIDSTTFKLFLDCAMKFKPTTRQNAFEIFPVVWKCQVQQWIDECIDILLPKKMDKEMCRTLNMAVSYGCELLTNKILYSFLFGSDSPYKLLEDKAFTFSLEPRSMCKIVERISLDSVILNILIEWGLNYLEKNSTEFTSVRSLFEHFEIMDHIKYKFFLTTDELFKFATADLTKTFYTHNEIIVGMHSELLEHKRSEWKYIKAGDTFVERYIIPFPKHYKLPIFFFYKIILNTAVLFNRPAEPGGFSWLVGKVSVNDQHSQSFCCMEVTKGWHLKSKPELEFIVNRNDCCKSLRIKVTYSFRFDCRILMSSNPGNCIDSGDQNFFAQNLVFQGMHTLP